MKDASDIHKRLKRNRALAPSSEAIAGWEVEVGRDATGDEAVWVWVVLHDEHVQSVWATPKRDALRLWVREMVQKWTGSTETQIYVRFRTESEHKSVVGAAWTG